ncbi:aminoglycoside adenylyltransferase domain-containing protein [Gracilibacillus alcaliphilus]|uniref:aminoglycoside adenylyltransferase domain-containing protein n=1 Tax=Gracilibacillus alcaliphilus TaxID=1401441 RepID=UPI00195DCC4E|nr:aminoglycoside adenylyltransferase domain-containing protein [Gracilibacillus alcaliphilus]MBM7675734.1 streptomycin 3'-adenylyltransferase [Gracilibacillus alcaliphilus]
MSQPQKWPQVNSEIKDYVDQLVALLQSHLKQQLAGVYLHGSLATGSYYFPKSDIDILVVVTEPLVPDLAKKVSISIAKYSDLRPSIGDIELSVITADTAKHIPKPIPYQLHYSSSWRDRILNGDMQYGNEAFDTDLYVHLVYVKKRGYCLVGQPIDVVFGDVDWDDFMFGVLDDLEWILEKEHILESPYYGILNMCRSFQLLSKNVQIVYSKDEGGEWGLAHLPEAFHPLIQMTLSIYRSSEAVEESDRETGGLEWNREELLALRDYARERLSDYHN